MSKYKVFGDKLVDYYIDVEANSADEAWDIASAAGTHEWFEIERDTAIEVHFVDELHEDTSDLLEDGYPVIENDILVTDKSDNQELGCVQRAQSSRYGVFTNSRKFGKIYIDHRKDHINGNKA